MTDMQDVATVKDTAAQTVSEFIRSPDLFQFDLFESPTITQLKGDSQYGHLYQLLVIIGNDTLSVHSLSPAQASSQQVTMKKILSSSKKQHAMVILWQV